MAQTKIFFNEELHRYTDDANNTYTSVTTFLKQFYPSFEDEKLEIARACSEIGKNPTHPKYEKYKDKSAAEIIKEWSEEGKKGRTRGTKIHNYLEQQIKSITNYTIVEGDFINDEMFTTEHIITEPKYGTIDPDALLTLEMKQRYLKLYNFIETLAEKGYKLYAEICSYSIKHLISGLIDLLAVKDNAFIIIDHKTNKNPIEFRSGYYEKDHNGILTGNFVEQNKYFKYPVHHLPSSIGNIYATQISTYAKLTELLTGLKYLKGILCHIAPTLGGEEIVDLLPMPDLTRESLLMMDYFINLNKSQSQPSLF